MGKIHWKENMNDRKSWEKIVDEANKQQHVSVLMKKTGVTPQNKLIN